MYKPKHPPVYTSCKLQYILFMSAVSQNESGEEGGKDRWGEGCLCLRACVCVCVYQGKHGMIPTERPMQTSPTKSSREH